MKGLFIPGITAEMFRNGCYESIEALMAEGEIYDIDYTRWIPCTERLPEEHEWIGTKEFGTTISDEVYVTFEIPKGERFAKHLRFQNGRVSNAVQREIDVFHKGSVPVAWMPLPQPYKAETKNRVGLNFADQDTMMPAT